MGFFDDVFDVVGDAAGGVMGATLGPALDIFTGEESIDKATKAQSEAQSEANALLWDMFQQTQETQKPWTEAGANALTTLQELISQGPGEFTQSPGYEWAMKQGVNALDRSAASKGRLRSGAQDKALLQYGQRLALQDYDNFLNRYYQSLNPYQSLAGQGQTAVDQSTQTTGDYTNALAQNLLAGGTTRASGYMNKANALSNLLGQGGTLAAMAMLN